MAWQHPILHFRLQVVGLEHLSPILQHKLWGYSSSQAGSHVIPSTTEPMNWFSHQEDLLDLQILQSFLLSLKVLPFLYQSINIHLFYPQFNRLHSLHSGFNRIFLHLSPTTQMTFLDCRGSAQASHFLLIPPTIVHLAFSIWFQLLSFQVGMSILSCVLVSRGNC